MPVRITPTRRCCRGPRLARLGIMLLGGLAGQPATHAEPFETVAQMPSVLAQSTDRPAVPYAGADFGERVVEQQPIADGSWLVGDGQGSVAIAGDGADATACGPDCPAPGDCQVCGSRGGTCCPGRCCDPPGLMQFLAALHGHSGACWTGRADALILWRNAPSSRPLFDFNNNGVPGRTALNANQLESPAAGGARVALLRKDRCGGIWEFGYLYGGQFFSQKQLPFSQAGYLTSAPGIYGNDSPPINSLDTGIARLTGSIQTTEINRRWCHGGNIQFLAGFRWLQWYEMATVGDVYASGTPNEGLDAYQTTCVNNLFGGQIGLDSLLWTTASGLRLEGLVKAGAYGNNAAQSSSYLNLATGAAPYSNAVGVRQYPASCSFVGEVGLTGVLPISDCWDFRLGYVGLWVTGLAQPTNQLSGQSLAQGNPTSGSLSTTGTVIIQGVSLGLEGRW